MAFAEWPADEEEIFYHVQYDWNQEDDEYAPTVFTITGVDELRVAGMANSEGVADGYRIAGVGDAPSGYQLVANDVVEGGVFPACEIEVTAEGQYPLICNIGGNNVNTRKIDGLWALMPEGPEDGFQNFVMAAGDVHLDDGDGGEGGGVIDLK
ncbi:hypothetical protein CERZMDRAFT_99659 [Cercospora zeae-maydis SCOH1-5]|uniref:Uncharacterized protein n=1 Tax=Cercospora zeae-maydis SCOH1-5 TaxID=717836 RepID=A0A6A6FA83_9PEZI|nr:hypothetical protein CERZMDRAFT_99659 [Cercospora zeae-maydis SCOH1-5]